MEFLYDNKFPAFHQNYIEQGFSILRIARAKT